MELKIQEIDNCFCANLKIKWGDFKDPFMLKNQPTAFQHDYDVKKHILDCALTFPKNVCIIDAGAHIGDGIIPIAQSLIKNGRDDIILYAIDPTKEKCDYITYMCNLNNLDNVRIIHCGLTDILENRVPDPNQDIYEGNDRANSGATQWVINCGGTQFMTIDKLVEDGNIREPIGFIHLDVEGMESKVIKGGLKAINMYLPIISLEQNYTDCFGGKPLPNETESFKLLPHSYQNTSIIGHNYIYTG